MFTFDISRRIPKAIVKSNALQVFTLSILGLVFHSVIPVFLLTLDFGLRAFNLGKYSLLTAISKKLIVPLFNLNDGHVSLAPKAFAARIGFTLSVISFICYLNNYNEGYLAPILLLTIFSFLEGFFDFCAGCKIYGLLIHLNIFNEEDCIDCKLD